MSHDDRKSLIVTVESLDNHPLSARAESTDSGALSIRTEPLTDRCRVIGDAGIHACIGISPFNSYFTAERIAGLASWAQAGFESVHFYVPDGPSAYTLEAVGYAPERAAHKAHRQGRWLGNKLRRTPTDLGVTDPDPLVLDSAALLTNRPYQRLHHEVSEHYATDPEFAAACLDASGWVLQQRLPDGVAPTDQQRQAAVRYLLAELPLFTDTAAIVGARSSVFCYHQRPAFLQALYDHQLTWKPVPHQGFLVLTATGDSPEPSQPAYDARNDDRKEGTR